VSLSLIDVKTPNYTIEIFENIGYAVCMALLDIIEKNPVSRLPSSQYKNIQVSYTITSYSHRT